jgi:hypothetical protein
MSPLFATQSSFHPAGDLIWHGQGTTPRALPATTKARPKLQRYVDNVWNSINPQ